MDPCKNNVRDDGLYERRWYCVCAKCGAKLFSSRKSFACPRCGNQMYAAERIVPPWRCQTVLSDLHHKKE
jgi:predicted RNA-binding Zn-ribbon protein involved in translation (DUF1610 family)